MRDKVVLMDPAVVADLQYTDNQKDLQEMFEPLKLENKDLIILPVNDNMN